MTNQQENTKIEGAGAAAKAPSIEEIVSALAQQFPTRDETEEIARNVVPGSILNVDAVNSLDGFDVLRAPRAPRGTTSNTAPSAFWGKAVTALKKVVGATTEAMHGDVEVAEGAYVTLAVSGNKLTISVDSAELLRRVWELLAGYCVTRLNGLLGELTLVNGGGVKVTPNAGAYQIALATDSALPPTTLDVVTNVQWDDENARLIGSASRLTITNGLITAISEIASGATIAQAESCDT